MKKSIMMDQYNELKMNKSLNIKKIKLILDVDGTEEVIINSDIEKKIAYVEQAYNDDLELKNNTNIKIIDWEFLKEDINESNTLSFIIREAFKTHKPFSNNDFLRDGICIRLYFPQKTDPINSPTMVICYSDGFREAWSPRTLDFLRSDWVLCEEDIEKEEDTKDE